MFKIIFIAYLLIFASLVTVAQSIKKELIITDSIKIELVQIPFDSSKHDIIYGKHGLVYLIDNNLVYGTDAILPHNQLTGAMLTIKDKVYHLNTEGMFDPNLEIIDLETISVTQNYSGYVVRMLLSVGAGFYGVEWIIISDKSYRTILTNDWKILENDFLLKEDFSDEEPKK